VREQSAPAFSSKLNPGRENMRTFQTSVICLFGACWLAISTPADGENSMDNSSRDTVGHNSFDLKPAPAAAAQDAQTPPPKIILNGIMTAFGIHPESSCLE